MTKVTSLPKSKSNGSTEPKENGSAVVDQAKEIINGEAPVVVQKVMSLQERIQRIENLQLLVEKRSKLVQTRSELERFQISSNDFNCQLRLNDSDGNVFTSSFTPGIKKVIEFLKSSFDSSISDVEKQINF